MPAFKAHVPKQALPPGVIVSSFAIEAAKRQVTAIVSAVCHCRLISPLPAAQTPACLPADHCCAMAMVLSANSAGTKHILCLQEEAQSSFQGAAMSPGVGIHSVLNKRSLPALQKTESVPDVVMAAAQVSIYVSAS